MATKQSGPLTQAQVEELMWAKLRFSLLDRADAKALGFKAMTALGARPLGLSTTKAGFKIPYFDPNGEELKFFRFRYLEDTRSGFLAATGAKAQRYAQKANSPVEVYLPPNGNNTWAEIFEDVTTPILITEGELKAACATKFGIPTMGLGGVWSFQSAKAEIPLLPIFDEIDLADRSVYICYDSDGATNPQVVAAETRLAKRLLERGAIVGICRLQPAPPNEPGGDPYKVGVDDYIVAHGVEQFQSEILNNAFPYAASEALHTLNERVVYVRNPGIIWDHQEQMRLPPSAFVQHAFSNLHFTESRTMANGTEKMVKVPAAKAWMEWEHRAECSALAFEPGQGRITQGGHLNTWLGWGVPEPMEGDYSEWDRLMGHIFGEDLDARRWFEMWAACPLQNPGIKMHSAVAVWGPVHGSGKTLVGATLSRIYGRHAEELKDSDLEDDRKEWAENKQFILADDITSNLDRKFMRRLMTMVTQAKLRINAKYIPSYSLRDTINYYFTSNDPDALFMDDQDRRFFVHRVDADKFPNHMRYVEWMQSASGIAALWHYLLQLDISSFDPFAPAPSTISKTSMIEMGKSELGAWVLDLKQSTELVLARGKIKGDLVSAKQLHAMFDPNGDKRASVNAMARELSRSGFRAPANGVKLKLSNGAQVNTYVMRNFEMWKKATWREACTHYEVSNPHLVADPKSGKKF